jgi:TolA-binding protein
MPAIAEVRNCLPVLLSKACQLALTLALTGTAPAWCDDVSPDMAAPPAAPNSATATGGAAPATDTAVPPASTGSAKPNEATDSAGAATVSASTRSAQSPDSSAISSPNASNGGSAKSESVQSSSGTMSAPERAAAQGTGAVASETAKKVDVKSLNPADRPPPKGQDAAVKLYSAKKFAAARAQFEKFVSDGTADINTYAYLAYCLYNQRQYSKAVRAFDFVAKNATHSLTLQRSAENSASTLRSYMSGVCPGSCIKANDPRWGRLEGHPADEDWLKFPDQDHQGYHAWSRHHIGEVIVYEHGIAVNKGKCPICGGTGVVGRLKDGDPLPH